VPYGLDPSVTGALVAHAHVSGVMGRTDDYVPKTNIFGLDVAGFEAYFGWEAKGDQEAGAGERSDDQSLDSISDIPCEDATCEHATRDVTACEDTVLLPAVGEPPLEQSELSANAMYAGETTQATLECESLVSTVDRACAESLSHFSDLCVDELQDKISPILRTKFGHNSVTSRNTGFAKKSMFRDLRCP